MSKRIVRITFVCLVFCLVFIGKDTVVESHQQESKEEIKTVQTEIPNRLFGLTIDESSIDFKEQILRELRTIRDSNLANDPPTVRLVLPVECVREDENSKCLQYDTNKLDDKYVDLIKELKKEYKGKVLAFVMAEIMDSTKEMSSSCFMKKDGKLNTERSKECYLNRAKTFFDRLKNRLKKGENENYVDIWEIGNEINGDWFGETEDTEKEKAKRREIVVAQVSAVYEEFRKKGAKTAITYYFNGDGKRNAYEDADEDEGMVKWINNKGDHFKKDKKDKEENINFFDVDYVFISYYPDDNFYTPEEGDLKFNPQTPDKEIPIDLSVEDWLKIFDLIKYKDKAKKIRNFSEKTKFGIGEMGTHCKFKNCNDKNSCERENIDKCCRSSGCCPKSQVDIIKEDYTDLDMAIRRSIGNNSLKGSDFVGGYFYWFYSEDVINKMVQGNVAEKQLAENTRNAIILAYQKWNAPLPNNSLLLQNSEIQNTNSKYRKKSLIQPKKTKSIPIKKKLSQTQPQIRILQTGDNKPNPYTIVIVNNPAYQAEDGSINRDPINDNPDKFNRSVDYIYANLFGNLTHQSERFLADDTIKDKIRVVAVYAPNFAIVEGNALIHIESTVEDGEVKQQLETRQETTFPKFLSPFIPYPDVVFVVSDYPNSSIKATAWRTIEDESSCGGSFRFTFGLIKSCHYYFPGISGGVGIQVNDRSMTALHEFSHAASGKSNGYIADLYNETMTEDFIVNKKFDKKYKKEKNRVGIFFTYQEKPYSLDSYKDDNVKTTIESERSPTIFSTLKFPALMDNYTVTPNGFPEQCQHDKLTRQFLLDRIRAKTQR